MNIHCFDSAWGSIQEAALFWGVLVGARGRLQELGVIGHVGAASFILQREVQELLCTSERAWERECFKFSFFV